MSVFNIFKNTKGEPEETGEEVEAMAEQNRRKRHMYLALDENREVILNDELEPFFRTVEDGSSPDWPDTIHRYAAKVIIDRELCVEVRETPANLSKKDREQAKKEIKENAKEQLMELAADKIEAVRRKLGKPDAQADQKWRTKEEPIIEEHDSFSGSDTKITRPAVNTGATMDGMKAEEKENVSSVPGYDQAEEAIVNNPVSMIEAVKDAVDPLRADFNDAVDDLIEIIDKNGKENVSSIKAQIEAQVKYAKDSSKKYADDAAQSVIQKSQKCAENIINRVNETSRGISEAQDEISSGVNGVGNRLKELGESVESIEGDLHRLDQLDEIAGLLRNKGLTMSMEIPPVNADEEDIINLVRYSQKITEQLGYAARDLVRKQKAFESRDESKANEQKVMDQKIAKAHDEGVSEGQKQVVKKLLSKYEDVDALRESDNNYVHVIWTLLMELGVSIDGEGCYEKGKEVDLSDADIQKMIAAYSKLEGAGTYKVVRTGICFQGEILCNAIFEKVSGEVIPDNGPEVAPKKANN